VFEFCILKLTKVCVCFVICYIYIYGYMAAILWFLFCCVRDADEKGEKGFFD